MRVLLVNKFHYLKGGSEKYYFELGKLLENKGHEVAFFSMKDEKNISTGNREFFTDTIDLNNANKLKCLEVIYSRRNYKKMINAIEEFKPDVIHLNNFQRQLSSSVVMAAKHKKIPIVYTAHDVQAICPAITMLDRDKKICELCMNGKYVNCVRKKCNKNSILKSIIGAIEGMYYRKRKIYEKKINAIITPTNFYKEKFIQDGINADKIYSLHNFINLDEYNCEIEDEGYALYVGRLSEEKGIINLIKAFKKSNRNKLYIAGDGPDKDRIVEYIKNEQLEEKIKLLGYLKGNEIKEYVRKCRFVVVPSIWYENCPYSILETLSIGKPIVGSRIGGIPELVIDNKTGLLFDATSIEDLSNKMNLLFDNENMARKLGINAKKYAKDNFSMDNYYNNIIKIYENCINQKNKGDLYMSEKKLNGTVIVTYRCNARCTMCNRYKAPSKPEEEISIETIKKLPKMYFTNITGGEPFIREDLPDLVRELYKKSDRIVISTNGFFTDRIIKLCEEFPNIGIRISIEGLEETNNKIRGLEDGFNKGYSTLKKLVEMKHPDVGFGMTVQDTNAKDLVALYDLSNELNMEFATASLHNSFYFVEAKNIIKDRMMVAKEFEKLINKLLKSKSPKKWFRAYFNHGLINYIFGQKRLLPCDMAFDTFFIDPYGDVMPCNGTKDKEVMGNLNDQTWEELWNSKQAEKVRNKVRHCDRNCWMIGSASPAIHKYIWKPMWWIVKHKFLKFYKKQKYSMFENKIVRDYRYGKVTKEELDKCSTCDMKCEVNDGLSEASKEQLKVKSGEDIVNEDIARQMEK